MKRILSVALILVMVLACISEATAESTLVYTWHDIAQTQVKTEAYYEDGVLRQLTEYPIAGSTSVYTRTAWDEDGKRSSEEIASVDEGTHIQTRITSYFYEEGDNVSYQYQSKTQLDASGNYVEQLSWGDRSFYTDGRVRYAYTSDNEGNSEWKSFDKAGRITVQGTETFTDDLKGNYVETLYTYNSKDEVTMTSVSTRTTDLESRSYTGKTVVKDAKGRILEQTETAYVQKNDENGNFLGSTTNEITKYFDENGALLKTDTFSQESDRDYNEIASKRAVNNAQNVMTSSVDSTRKFDLDLPWDINNMGYANKSTMYDGTTGGVLASIKIEDEKTRDEFGGITSEKRTSVNQTGTLIASYVFEDKGAEGSTAKTQYFHEDTGKLRKVEDTVVAYDKDGKYLSTTTVKNATNIITEITSEVERSSGTQDLWSIETRKYDSVTGKLKSTMYVNNIPGKSSETSVKNAAGVLLSKVLEKYSTDVEGFEITETLYSKYDASSGALMGESKGVRTFKSDSQWYDSVVRFDQQGNKVREYQQGPLFDADKQVIGSFYLDASYNELGKVDWYARTEETYLKNKSSEWVGSVSVTKNQDGVIIYQSENREQYDERGLYLGNTSTYTSYALDGSVINKFVTTYNVDTKTQENIETNAKGRVTYRSTELVKKDEWYDGEFDRQLEKTRIENVYSEFTGNLMTTTTVKTNQERTGVFEENERKVKASGHLVRVSDISYMFVDEYGYMNYQNHYTNYLYRADGSLKYTIKGTGLIDNYYFDLFMEDYNPYGTYPDPTEIIETTTASSGVLTKEYHFMKDIEGDRYYNDYEGELYDYSKETKVYDEKTGALKFITTEVEDVDPVTLRKTTHTVTVNPEGKLLAESTSAYEDDVNGRNVYLGRQRVAFNDEGSQIATYNRDVEGKYERTNKTFNEATGSLLISETRKGEINGGETAEVLTYDAAGNVIRRETEKSGTDNTTGAYTYLNEAFDAAGKLLYRSANTETTKSDGSVISRLDEVDAAGRVTYYEGVHKLGPDGWASELVSETKTYYDEDDLFRKEVTEGNKTTVYNDLQQVLTITVKDEYGVSRTTDAAGKLLYYSTISDAGDLSEFYANGKPKLIVARDDDDEVRETSFDKNGYINYVSIDHPDRPYTMYYDGNGKVSEVFYNDGAGRSAYYNAADKQWYRGTGDDKVAIAVPDFADEIDMSDIVTGGKAKPRGVWYPNNTTGTFGIHLRDVRPELTSKWYTVTPIDLSQDGTQSFELVGGNMWIIGQVNVKVEGDKVTVTYDIIKDGIGRTTTKSEYLNIFSDLNSITEEALEGDSKDGKGYEFGQPISIEKDLGGDTNVLLYVRNVATFNTRVYGERYLVRMWENLPERRERRDAMVEMMDPLTEEAAEVTSK